MKKSLMLLMLLSASSGYAQGVRARVVNVEGVKYDNGKTLYDEGKYDEAISMFEEVLEVAPDNQDAIYYAGLSCRYSGKPEKAIAHFKKLETLNPDYWAWFYYEEGVAYSLLKDVDQAAKAFRTFEKKMPYKASNVNYIHKGKYRLHGVEQQATLNALKPQMKEPVKLSLTVNSIYPEYMPALDPTGTKLYFTSSRVGGIKKETAGETDGDEDLYFIEKIGGNWSVPMLLPEPINSESNDGAACFSVDGQLMVYGACGREGGVGSCDLYYSTLEGSSWTKPVNMGNVVNSTDWDAQPTISFDGNRIIFASTRDGGYGGEDLYMVERNIFGDWGPAMNLGGIVNTPFDDASPFLAQDGKTLYFASTGHPGYGDEDIFKTVYEYGKWSIPVNLGRPLNTAGADRFFTIGGSGEIGYFSSNREGNTQEDLYEIEIPEDMRPQPTVVVEGTVTNSKSGEHVGAYVMVEDINTGALIAVNKSNSVTGKYLTVLPAGKTYSVSANKEGYLFHSELFDVPTTSKYQVIQKDIGLRPIEKGAKVVLNNIFFDTGKATLSPQSRLELQKAIDLMKVNPTMIIEVGGHTDNVGDDTFNMKLSHDRAKSVVNYFAGGGIPIARLQAKGYGELNPIATNDTEDGRKSNRRTEFIILEF